MRFGLVHRILLDVIAALGLLAVISTASLGPWTNAALLLGAGAAICIPQSWQNRALMRHFATAAPLALFVVQGFRLLLGRSALDVAVEFAALLQIVRLATRRGAAHDQHIIVLSLLHLVAGTVLGGGISYGLCFLAFLVVAPPALVLSHLRREVEGNYRQGARDRTGLPVDVPRILRSRRVVGRSFLAATSLLSVPILAFTIALFVLFPRIGLSLLLLNHPRAGRMVGFSDHVDLGEVGVLRTDPSIALRFEVRALPDPPPSRVTLRLRGTAFDTYDGRAWNRSRSERHLADATHNQPLIYPLYRRPDPATDRRIAIDLEPIDPPVLFLPPRTIAIRVNLPNQVLLTEPFNLQRGPEGELRYGGAETHGLRYEAFLADDYEIFAERLDAVDRTRYLEVPATLPPRIAAVARAWADGLPTDLAKARAIEEHLRKDFRYDLTSPSGGFPQPLDHFLFESKRGHCEFFSTAMAVMLRDVGIPSRNVTGFVGGTYNRFGHYFAVRQGDAHSWVEAYLDDPVHPGWYTFDPTPAAGAQPLHDTTGTLVYLRDLVDALSQRWNRYVVGYDLGAQARLFREMGQNYDRLCARAGLQTGPLERATRAPTLAAGLLATALVLYLLWRHGRLRWRPRGARSLRLPAARQAESVAQLYRSLEAALTVHGIVRSPATPPLRHAEQLHAQQHPLADEVLALTSVYLRARFGGAELVGATKQNFEARVRNIRNARTAPAPSTHLPPATPVKS